MSDERQNVLAFQFVWRGKVYGISMTTPERSPMRHALLPKRKPRVVAFSTAFGLQLTLVLLILVLSALVPERFDAVGRYLLTPIIPQPVSAWKSRPTRRTASANHPVPAPPEVTPTKPTIPSPIATAPVFKSTKSDRKPESVSLPEATSRTAAPSTDLLLGSQAIPTLKKPREEVQTGGFGDPEGAAASNKRDGPPNITQLGSYDRAVGSGSGNGLGGRISVAGVTASVGFGEGHPASPGRPSRRGNVEEGLFAASQPGTKAPRIKPVVDAPGSTPVQILFKPKPRYTDAARSKKIEGEVLLEVTFLASGEIRIERIVKGLDEGLDESAETAARQIRFRPATQDGQPINSTAIIHIVFQLAY